jgi:hypothetical protein
VLAVTVNKAHYLLGLARDLIVKLPMTSAALRDGIIDERKATIVADHCANLTPEQARRAEPILFALPDVASMTPSMIRYRIARAVMEVDADAARRRREKAAKEECAVLTDAESSGNMMIVARELPAATVLQLDAMIAARAAQLRKAGLKGSLRELRVQAFLERFGITGPLGPIPVTAGPLPASAAGLPLTLHLTAPAATITGQADRPGELSGTPLDPGGCLDLADAATGASGTAWEFTITDKHGRPVAHACGTPGPHDKTRRSQARPGARPGKARHGKAGHDRTVTREPGSEQPVIDKVAGGPDPRYGTWRYRHRDREILFAFEHLSGRCDHRHQSARHDPGKHLRHLTGILNTTCTCPVCRFPEHRTDYEHSVPYRLGGRTCLCDAGPVCRREHRAKQRPGWKVEHAGAIGWFRWTVPSGRTYLSAPTSYPV